MRFFTIIVGVSLAALAAAEASNEPSIDLVSRNLTLIEETEVEDPIDVLARATSCKAPQGSGSCKAVSDCKTNGFNVAGYCPGSRSIQCCIQKTCSTSKGKGTCLNTSDGCSGGSFLSGACPGDSSIKCCVKNPTSGGGTTTPSRGLKVVNAAKAKEGIPYVFGGGGCKGKSNGGFDCSGLTQYAHCHALNVTIPRVARDQYSSSKGKHIPRSQAKAGDLIFWAHGGKCHGSYVSHVGIFIRKGWMVNAARTGTPVREQSIWTSYGGLEICPDAVRYW
ncbi:hypothetical protein BKA62DRAFT_757759 [Auriculariales sp. MPI-PUGE-AT-0066]|nr:hypothetical protein BKA62DRAFT_757759 [Auriculariales sp. MPI-PUGE-AT-0066]